MKIIYVISMFTNFRYSLEVGKSFVKQHQIYRWLAQ